MLKKILDTKNLVFNNSLLILSLHTYPYIVPLTTKSRIPGIIIWDIYTEELELSNT